jgi:hypothetical protein
MVVAVVSEPAMKMSFKLRKMDSFERDKSSSGKGREGRGEREGHGPD